MVLYFVAQCVQYREKISEYVRFSGQTDFSAYDFFD